MTNVTINVRFLFPSISLGAIMGKGGSVINATRDSSGCKINVEDICDAPERLLTISGTVEAVTTAIKMMMQNICDDFSGVSPKSRPPCVKGRGQNVTTFDHNDVQCCMICPGPQCGPIIGREGSRVKAYHQETGAYVFIHNDFISGEFLPQSNEKIVTITGNPTNIGTAVNRICNIIIDEPVNSEVYPYDPSMGGPTFFFDQKSMTKGWGTAQQFGAGPQIDANGVISYKYECNDGWAGCRPKMDVFMEKVEEERVSETQAKITVQYSHFNSICGRNNQRLEEIKSMSDAQIAIADIDEDCCYRGFMLSGADKMVLDNAIWLMNVALNAYTGDKNASLAPGKGRDGTLQDVVVSESYGMPPGAPEPAPQQDNSQDMIFQQQQQAQMMMAQQNSGYGGGNFGGGNNFGNQNQNNFGGNQQGGFNGNNSFDGGVDFTLDQYSNARGFGGNSGGFNQGGGNFGGNQGGFGGQKRRSTGVSGGDFKRGRGGGGRGAGGRGGGRGRGNRGRGGR